jgi:hypothetical protein
MNYLRLLRRVSFAADEIRGGSPSSQGGLKLGSWSRVALLSAEIEPSGFDRTPDVPGNSSGRPPVAGRRYLWRDGNTV